MFGGTVIVMLLTAINYQITLGYALTFLITGVGLASMVHTWRNLVGLGLRAGRAEPVHSGELIEWSVVCNNNQSRARFAIEWHIPGTVQGHLVDLAADTESLLQVALPAAPRGVLQVPRLRISTRWPLGLWRAWAWWQPQTSVFVWPHLETPGAPLPEGQGQGHEYTGPGQDNFAAVRPFQNGDTPRRLAWKAMARLGCDELLVHQFEGGRGQHLTLRWQDLPASMPSEARLARLARWVVQADAAGMRYALTVPGKHLALDSGPSHRAACLDALALVEV